MAKIERVEYVDDFDGRPVDAEDITTVEFEVTLPGRRAARYAIDLRAANVDKFEKDLSKYTKRATKVSASPSRTGGRGRTPQTRTQRVRRWAVANGYDLAERGRIPAHVVAAFDEQNR
jgi:hypothetical protein